MITALFILVVAMGLLTGVAFLSFAFWIHKHFSFTLPLWLAGSVVVFAVLKTLSAQHLSNALYEMIDVRGLSSEAAVFRANILHYVSSLFRTLGTAFLVALGISETVGLTKLISEETVGLWSRFRFSRRANATLGILSVSSTFLCFGIPLLYYKIVL